MEHKIHNNLLFMLRDFDSNQIRSRLIEQSSLERLVPQVGCHDMCLHGDQL